MPYRIVYELGGKKHTSFAEEDSLSGALSPEKPLTWVSVKTRQEKLLTPSVPASVTRITEEQYPVKVQRAIEEREESREEMEA